MNQQDSNIPNDPSQRVIEDVVTKLSSLEDDSNEPLFNTVLPLSQISYAEILETATPGAFVYFGEEAEGGAAADYFDEWDFYPFLEILFLQYIPNNDDQTFPDIQRMQRALHWKVLYNLRRPTDDDAHGLEPPVNPVTGKLLYEFRNIEGGGQKVKHNFDVRTKWIEEGREIKNQYYLSSVRFQVWVNNRPDV